MSTKADYFSLDGQVMLRRVSSVGAAISAWLHMGDEPAFGYEITSESNDIKESMTSKRQVFISIPVGQEATLSMTMRNLQAETMEIMNRGKIKVSAGGSVLAENLGQPKNGDFTPLDRQLVSALVITDSDGTPATLVDGEHFTYDPVIGLIQWIEVEDFEGDLKAAYTYGASKTVSILSLPAGYYEVRFLGKNKIPGGKNMVAGFYKVQFDPKGLNLIADEVNAVECTAKILADLSKPEDEEVGQYGYIRTFESTVTP